MNLFDTADSYGPEVAESLIAEALYPYPKDLVIATKGGLLRTGPNQWPQDGRPEHLREALEGSLRRLRLERIDIYQFHRPDPKVPFEDSVGELAKLQAGRQDSPCRTLECHARSSWHEHKRSSRLSRCRTIIIWRSASPNRCPSPQSEEMIDLCARQGIGFIPWNPWRLENCSLNRVDH